MRWSATIKILIGVRTLRMKNYLKSLCCMLPLAGTVLIPLQRGHAEDVPKPVALQSYTVLAGEWQRTDGNYVIAVSDVQPDGKVTVKYFNPNPIHVEQAAVTTREGVIQLSIKLRDKGYEGSTYTPLLLRGKRRFGRLLLPGDPGQNV